MFYPLSAVFLIALAAHLADEATPAGSAALLVLAIACAVRGYSVRNTLRETSRKLRGAVQHLPARARARGSAAGG